MSLAKPTLAERARAVVRGLWNAPQTVLLVAWLWSRQRALHRRAIAALRRAVKRPSATPEPLRALEPGLYEVDAALLGGDAPGPSALTVIHLLGTGENVYSPLVGLLALCEREPRLRACRHVIVDTPHDAACFLGPNEFATRLRRVLAPELARCRDRLVLVGLSRGATAAIDLGAELSLSTRRIGVLALSAPLARPASAPLTVLNIGAFETVTEHYVHQTALFPWATAFADFLFRRIYIRFCAFVLAELRMVSEAQIAMYARYIARCDPKLACLRAVREFALLGRVSDAELRHALSGAVRRLSSADGARVLCGWGKDDPWVEIEPCVASLGVALERHGVPAERVTLHVLAGVGHGISREPGQDFGEVAALLWQACEHAMRAPSTEPKPRAMNAEPTGRTP